MPSNQGRCIRIQVLCFEFNRLETKQSNKLLSSPASFSRTALFLNSLACAWYQATSCFCIRACFQLIFSADLAMAAWQLCPIDALSDEEPLAPVEPQRDAKPGGKRKSEAKAANPPVSAHEVRTRVVKVTRLLCKCCKRSRATAGTNAVSCLHRFAEDVDRLAEWRLKFVNLHKLDQDKAVAQLCPVCQMFVNFLATPAYYGFCS